MPIISECTFQDFDLLLSSQVVSDLSDIGKANECEFQLPVFAYPTDTTDKYRNDNYNPLFTGTNRYASPAFFLEVQNNCGWTQVAALNDNTYGKFNTFTSNSNWLGYELKWHLVESLQGVGCYRVRLEYTDVTDATVKTEFSYKFNLKIFTDDLADKTTKIEYRIDGGKTGDKSDDKGVINYGNISWTREVRLPNSLFGFSFDNTTKEYTKFKTGAEIYIKDISVESYNFEARKLPSSLHRELKIVAFKSDRIFISDYNKSNPELSQFNRKRVNLNSDYNPKWYLNRSFASVELEFAQHFQNNERKRC